MFETFSYRVVPRLIDPAAARMVANYARAKYLLGQMRKGDARVTGAPNLYRDALTEVLLVDLLAACEANTGLALIPSFSYLRLHFSGAVLPEHTDRPGAEIAVSVDLGGDEEWPLWLKVGGEPTRIDLGLGDAVLFRGGLLPHWRDAFGGTHHVQVLLCYVVKGGACVPDGPAEHPLLPLIADKVA